MSNLQGKNILLGVTGGIAAYKSALLVRLLVKEGANIKVILTESAKAFVTPLTLSVLSKNKVYTEFVENNEWNNHVDLALWADVMIIAPATANTLSKMATGLCNNLLLATYLSAKCPVYFAPAMDLDMYKHPTTKENISKIQSFGNYLIPSEKGELASGLIGEGRMAEPETILSHIKSHFTSNELEGKTVLITAGPTYEAIDPVRFIGNHSSGKMGITLANQAIQMGAKVILILGPSSQINISPRVEVIRVVSAKDMYEKTHQFFPESDIAILSAAVADYKPKQKSVQKIKKSTETFTLELESTQDILVSLGQIKEHQILVGFALETENETENAKAKIANKKLDAIVLNSLNDKGAGFGFDTNKITFITADETETSYELKTKKEVAKDILESILELL